MNEEEKKAQEAAEAEKAEAAEDLSQKEVDYKVIAEANEELAKAEKARADAAEALIIKNKALQKREEKKNDNESEALTEDKVAEIVQKTLAQAKENNDSPEAKALEEANKKLAEIQAKNAEIIRAQKAKETISKDSAQTVVDAEKGVEPKLEANSPLKEYKFMGNGVYSQKLASGKTHYVRNPKVPGLPNSWVA